MPAGRPRAPGLVRDLPAGRVARIDPEEFFVFTQERPEVCPLGKGRTRLKLSLNDIATEPARGMSAVISSFVSGRCAGAKPTSSEK
jgi:hypothetical protein